MSQAWPQAWLGDIWRNISLEKGQMSVKSLPTRPARILSDPSSLSIVIDNLDEVVILADPAGVVRSMNRSALHILGYAAAEISGQPLSHFISRAAFAGAVGLNRLLQEGSAHVHAASLVASDGTEVPVALYAASIPNEEGQPGVVIIVGDDLRPSRELEELRVVHAVALAAAEATNEAALVERVTGIIGDALYPDNFGILLLDDETKQLRPHPSYRRGRGEAEDKLISLGEGITGSVAATGRPWRIPDVSREPAYVAADANMHSELCVPLRTGDRVIGVINAESATLDAFSQADERLLSTVAGQLATAIERVRLFSAERKRREMAEALQRAGVALSESLNFDTVLDRLLQQIELVVPFDSANVMLVDDGRVRVTRTRGYSAYGADVERKVRRYSQEIALVPAIRWMAKAGKPLVIADADREQQKIMAPIAGHVGSWAGAPIVVEGRATAFFSVEKREPGFYTQDHAESLSRFAGQAALSFQNARLFAESQRQTQELSALYDTSLVMGSILDVERLLRLLHHQVQALMATDVFTVALYHSSTQTVERIFLIQDGRINAEHGPELALDDAGLMGWVVKSHRSQLLGDLSAGTPQVEILESERQVRSWLGVPLVVRDELLGAVGVSSRKPNAFGEADRRFLEAIAGQTAVSLENARLFAVTEGRAKEAETLRQSAAVVTSTLQQENAMERILEQLSLVVPYDSAAVLLLREGAVEIVGGRGWEDPSVVVGMRFPIPGDNPNTIVIQSGRPYVLGDAPKAHAPFRRPPHDHINSWLGVPLIVQDQVIGMLSVDSVNKNYFTQDHVRLAAAFANHVAIALENARLFEDTRRRASELAMLLEISAQLRAASAGEEMLPAIVDKAARAVGAEYAAVFLTDPRSGEVAKRASFPANLDRPDGPWEVGGEIILSVAEKGNAQIFDRGSPQHAEDSANLAAGAISPNWQHAVLPLRSQDHIVGVLQLTKGGGRKFTVAGLDMLTAIADIAGNALDRANLMETLEERVRERTQELALANERLTELDRLKSEFVSNVSHELRTPITNIMLFLELLEAPGKEENRPNYMGVLKHEADRLARLIEDLLTLSRMEQEGLPFIPESLVLEPILAAIVSAHEARANDKKVSIRLKPNPGLPKVVASREQIVQVFTNLVDNAVAYTPPEGEIRVSSRLAERAGVKYVATKVVNTGPAIPEDDLPHIFERFYRGKTGRESGERGTGLGLAICQDILDRHNGMLEVETSESHGTAFTVWLPLAPLGADGGRISGG
jgi:PAS domain S-box-containing protein